MVEPMGRLSNILGMGEPKGFLLTWTCYGTWLWGDDRGSVDANHNAWGTPLLHKDPKRVAGLWRRMKHEPFQLSRNARKVVQDTIEDHCRLRGWELLAVNVRSNHVHAVVRFAGIAPEAMIGEWKSWGTRSLREQGLAEPIQPVWTKHGSTRYLWKESDLEPAIRYVLEGQEADRFGDRSNRRKPGDNQSTTRERGDNG